MSEQFTIPDPATPEYATRLSRVRQFAENRDGDGSEGVWRDDCEAVLARLDYLEEGFRVLRENQHITCIYCNHRTNREGRTDAEMTEAMNEHIMTCDKRPEALLTFVLAGIIKALGVDTDAIPQGDREALLLAAVQKTAALVEDKEILDFLNDEAEHIEIGIKREWEIYPRDFSMAEGDSIRSAARAAMEKAKATRRPDERA